MYTKYLSLLSTEVIYLNEVFLGDSSEYLFLGDICKYLLFSYYFQSSLLGFGIICLNELYVFSSLETTRNSLSARTIFQLNFLSITVICVNSLFFQYSEMHAKLFII